MGKTDPQNEAFARLADLKRRYVASLPSLTSESADISDEIVRGFMSYVAKELNIQIVSVTGPISHSTDDPARINQEMILGTLDQSSSGAIALVRGDSPASRRYSSARGSSGIRLPRCI